MKYVFFKKKTLRFLRVLYLFLFHIKNMFVQNKELEICPICQLNSIH